MNNKIILRPLSSGISGTVLLLIFYFTILTLLSGWDFALSQFFGFWYFIIALAIGLGVQIGLYVYLKNIIHKKAAGGVVAVSGAASTIAMISCCAHYLANILPIIAAGGVITLATQYQIQLFWVGLIFNLSGIIYIFNKIIKFKSISAKTS